MIELDRAKLVTEKQNPNTVDIDNRSIAEILKIINKEDQSVAVAVNNVLDEISEAVKLTLESIKNGNKVIYIGAGTSGRLGILDASEIPPTFSAPNDWFTGVIAGGRDAVFKSIEGAEDHAKDSHADLKNIGITDGDTVIGIASSSTTPYVIEGLNYAKKINCNTVFLICNPKNETFDVFDVVIPVNVGPEVITGSTRMKAGTATKMILNMISTATMIKMGKVYGNLMVDLQVVNKKLEDRGTRIISNLTGLDYNNAHRILLDAGGSVKTAIVMIRKKCTKDHANDLLAKGDGYLRDIIGDK